MTTKRKIGPTTTVLARGNDERIVFDVYSDRAVQTGLGDVQTLVPTEAYRRIDHLRSVGWRDLG